MEDPKSDGDMADSISKTKWPSPQTNKAEIHHNVQRIDQHAWKFQTLSGQHKQDKQVTIHYVSSCLDRALYYEI